MEKVRAGQPLRIKADDWNAFIDAANFVRQQELEQETARAAASEFSGIVRVKNVTQSQFPIYSCLYLSDLAIMPDENDPDKYYFQDIVFEASDSAAAVRSNSKLCILQEPLDPGKIGKAMILGVTHGKVNITNTDHCFAQPDEDGEMISAEEGQIQIIWQEGTSTGEQQCVLLIGQKSSAAAVSSGHPFDVKIVNNGTAETPEYAVKIYNSALPSSSYAGIVSIGTGTYSVPVDEITLTAEAEEGFWVDLVVTYDAETSPVYTIEFEIRTDEDWEDDDNVFRQTIAMGGVPEITSMQSDNIRITDRWV